MQRLRVRKGIEYFVNVIHQQDCSAINLLQHFEKGRERLLFKIHGIGTQQSVGSFGSFSPTVIKIEKAKTFEPEIR